MSSTAICTIPYAAETEFGEDRISFGNYREAIRLALEAENIGSVRCGGRCACSWSFKPVRS